MMSERETEDVGAVEVAGACEVGAVELQFVFGQRVEL